MTSETSDSAWRVLEWMAEVEDDPNRRACFINGTTLTAQAVADGIVASGKELAPLINELKLAGYIDFTLTRSDQ